MAEVSAFIHSVLLSVAPLMPDDLLPSSRGAMILRCGSLEDQDSLRLLSPFPNEHWYESKIKECFQGFCEVAKIDQASLTGDNFAPLRLLLEVNDRLEIPFEIRISSKLGVGRAGSVAKVLPIRVWPREYQLDSQGNLAHFFGPPPPPPRGPSLGPMGPFSRE